MSTYFIGTWQQKVTHKQAQEINTRIQQIDNEAAFVRHYAPGNATHGWLERPNDGTNDSNWRRAKNQQMLDIANEVLAGVTKPKEEYYDQRMIRLAREGDAAAREWCERHSVTPRPW